MSLAEYAALAVAAGVGAEATGTTAFTPMGERAREDGQSGPAVPSVPSGGPDLSGVAEAMRAAAEAGRSGRQQTPAVSDLAAALSAAQQQAPQVVTPRQPSGDGGPSTQDLIDAYRRGKDSVDDATDGGDSFREWWAENQPGKGGGGGDRGGGGGGSDDTPSFFEGLFGMKAPDPGGYTQEQAEGFGRAPMDFVLGGRREVQDAGLEGVVTDTLGDAEDSIRDAAESDAGQRIQRAGRYGPVAEVFGVADDLEDAGDSSSSSSSGGSSSLTRNLSPNTGSLLSDTGSPGNNQREDSGSSGSGSSGSDTGSPGNRENPDSGSGGNEEESRTRSGLREFARHEGLI